MKIYKRRPGVVLVEVCEEFLLVATGDARDHCPYITQINASAADYWRFLEQEQSLQSLVQKAKEHYERKDGGIIFASLQFVSKMQESGYLLAEDVP